MGASYKMLCCLWNHWDGILKPCIPPQPHSLPEEKKMLEIPFFWFGLLYFIYIRATKVPSEVLCVYKLVFTGNTLLKIK